MKNSTHFRLLLLTATFAFLGLLAGCGSKDDKPVVEPQSVTYTGIDGGTTYTLKITETIPTRAYTPRGGDTYMLTAGLTSSSGNVVSVSSESFTLKPSNSAETFVATVTGGDLTALEGKVTWSDNTFYQGPGKFERIQIKIVTQPADTIVNEGSITGNLKVVASAIPISTTLSYQWYQNSTKSYDDTAIAIAGATSTTLPIPTSLLSGVPDYPYTSYYFYCEVSANDATPIRSDLAAVSVKAPPVITLQPVSCTVSVGESATFTVEATSDYPLSYQWYARLPDNNSEWVEIEDGDSDLFGQTEACLSITNIPINGDGYQFRCMVSNNPSSYVWSEVAILSVTPDLPVITMNFPLDNFDVYEGFINTSVGAFARVTKGATLSYQWYSNTTNSNVGGTLIPDATHYFYTIPSTLTVGEYYYFCEVGATGGAIPIRSTVSTVRVVLPEGIPTIVTQPVDATVVEGGSTTFSVTAEGSDLRYAWSVGRYIADEGFVWSTIHNDNIYTYAQTGALRLREVPMSINGYQYECYVYNALYGVSTIPVKLTVTPIAPVITITSQPSDVTVIEGSITESLLVEASVTQGATLEYLWSVCDATGSQSVILPRETSCNFVITKELSVGVYYFFCRVMAEGATMVRSRVATVTVLPAVPVITITS
ncbi:MAG: immunoglobulin domain-containing protein, partial [Bacteroidetes bacterium]|nr:immunoglobulin domain-containing protein [Bacteroidota bacterium]